MSISVRSRVLALPMLAATLTFAACDDVTAPAGQFDAQTTAEAVQQVASATEATQDAFSSLELAGSLFAGSTGLDLASSYAVPTRPDADETRRLAEASAMATFFPSNYLGVTFVWDEHAGEYAASSESGAPADGVRLIYYAVDPTTGHPASPLNALGYLDMRDLSTASSSRLGVKVVRTAGGDATLADYYIDVSTASTQSQYSVLVTSIGFLSNGTDQVNFDLSQTSTVSDSEFAVTQDFSMGVEGTDVSIGYQGSLVTTSDNQISLAFTTTIANGADRVVFDLEGDIQSLAGSIRHNGVTVALVSVSPGSVTFTDADGNELTQEQMAALSELFGAVDGLAGFATGIFGPVASAN